MQPGITLAMIVKNGGESLNRCLKSVQGLVQQIIIVDTGSTDNSIQIAGQFGAQVVEIVWPGRFDLARNEAIKLVQTEWTLVLDCDEWLHDDFKQELTEIIQNDLAAGYYLRRFDLDERGSYGETYFLRLWRTHSEIQYNALIHEQIHASDLIRLTNRPHVPKAEVTVWHDGYVQPASLEKLRRDAELLEAQLQLTPNDPYFGANYAAALHKLGDPRFREVLEGVIDQLLVESQSSSELNPEYAVAITGFFSTLDLGQADHRRVQQVERIAWDRFGASPHVINALGEFHAGIGNALGAYAAFYRLAQMAESGNYDRQRSAPPALFGEMLWVRLAIVARHAGEREVAIHACKKLLQIDPRHKVGLEELRALGAHPS